METFAVTRVGRVVSGQKSAAAAARQPDEGAPAADLVFEPGFREALADVRPGDRMVVITWLDQASRITLAVHPRGDKSRPQVGVFSTRSASRPNPIGLHDVFVVASDGLRLTVAQLEAVDGTPILDLKPILGPVERR